MVHDQSTYAYGGNPEYLQKFIDRGDIRGYWSATNREAYERATPNPLDLGKNVDVWAVKAMGEVHWTNNLTAVQII